MLIHDNCMLGQYVQLQLCSAVLSSCVRIMAVCLWSSRQREYPSLVTCSSSFSSWTKLTLSVHLGFYKNLIWSHGNVLIFPAVSRAVCFVPFKFISHNTFTQTAHFAIACSARRLSPSFFVSLTCMSALKEFVVSIPGKTTNSHIAKIQTFYDPWSLLQTSTTSQKRLPSIFPYARSMLCTCNEGLVVATVLPISFSSPRKIHFRGSWTCLCTPAQVQEWRCSLSPMETSLRTNYFGIMYLLLLSNYIGGTAVSFHDQHLQICPHAVVEFSDQDWVHWCPWAVVFLELCMLSWMQPLTFGKIHWS